MRGRWALRAPEPVRLAGPKRLVDPVEQRHQLTLIVDLWPHLSRDDDLVLPIDSPSARCSTAGIPRRWSSLSGSRDVDDVRKAHGLMPMNCDEIC